MQAQVAIIAGTGIGDELGSLTGITVHQPTPFGCFRAKLAEMEGVKTLLIRRHSAGHKVPPHKVNYRAIAAGCKAFGVRAVLATAAVGSLRPEWPVGTIVVPDDFWDASGRNLTMFDDEVVHTDFTTALPLCDRLSQAAEALALPFQRGGVYVGGNGPRYETAAEIRFMQVAGDLAGMTAATEAVVFGELGIPFGLVCVVTNLATGLAPEPHAHEAVTKVMVERSAQVVQILKRAVASM